jgi:two-component system phosphate regulon response regulator OmpR
LRREPFAAVRFRPGVSFVTAPFQLSPRARQRMIVASNGGNARVADVPAIVVVDDEPDIREMLQDYLGRQGLDVRAAGDGAELDQVLAVRPAEVLVLDLNLPGEDGLTIARRVRARSRVGIVMLTARGEVEDRIRGLEQGADDYVVKPVEPRELLARIRSVLRRLAAEAKRSEAKAGSPTRKVRFGRCELDLDGHRLTTAHGDEIPLTAMEFDLLETFARHQGQVLTRDRISELAHNRPWQPLDRSIDIRITRLRQKIEVDPAEPRVIRTVRGEGYLFDPTAPG